MFGKKNSIYEDCRMVHGISDDAFAIEKSRKKKSKCAQERENLSTHGGDTSIEYCVDHLLPRV